MKDNATIQLQRGGAVGAAILAVIEAAALADSSKTKYKAAVNGYLAAGGSLTDPAALAAYANTLPHSGRAHLKAAVKLWTAAAINEAKGQATPDNVNQVQAMIYRFEALQTAVTVKASKGDKAHVWLSPVEVKKLMSRPGHDVIGQRDRLAMGLLVGAGLRRDEAVNLAFGDLIMQPVKGKLRSVLQVQGKGDKGRVIPISDNLAGLIDQWAAVAGGQGRILRSVNQKGEIGDSLSPAGLFKLVRGHGAEIGRPSLAPHDLRRTFAQIGYESGIAITQISKLLGHSSIATTQRYLNLDLDLQTTVSDFVVW